jgi:hypothetical protein
MDACAFICTNFPKLPKPTFVGYDEPETIFDVLGE